MDEEGKISMNEFKVIVEDFHGKLDRVVEVMNFRFDKVEKKLAQHDRQFKVLNEQIAVLHVGQTEIRSDIKEMRHEMHDMGTRVARLESRIA
jgi:flagellar biosynthesis chaperone FliJ